ncbi:MAG: hypothetical protein ACXVH7_13710 [Thermoanaerobaculia bacterium]
MSIFTNAVAAAWAQAAIYLVTLGVLIWQMVLLRRQVNLQNKAMQATDYLRCQIDFTETLRLLVRTQLHQRVYDELARTGSKFKGWTRYSDNEKAEYAYLELLYELLERIFVVWKSGAIDDPEWRQWRAWIEDVVHSPLFRDVVEDNDGMFDPRFEQFIRTLLPPPSNPARPEPAS